MVCGCSASTLPLPHHRGKSHTRGTNLNTVEFIHHHLTQPEVTPMDRIVHVVKNSPALYKKPLTSRATINYSLLTRSIRQSSAGQQAINLHVQNRPGPHLYTLTPNRALSCDLCAVPKKTNPPRHFQGWSFKSPWTYQCRPHLAQVQKNQYHVARGPTYPPWNEHLQGCTKQLTQRPLTGAHVHKP